MGGLEADVGGTFSRRSSPRPLAPAPLSTEELFRLLVESVDDYAILMLDTGGLVISWNRGAQRINGYQRDEILGRHFAVFYPPEAVSAGLPQRELELAASEGRCEHEGWRLRRDGTRYWAVVVTTAVRDDAGRLIGFAKVTRDVTARRRAEAEIKRHREDLEQLVAAQTEDLRDKNARLTEETRRAARLAVERRELVRQALEAEDQQRQRFSERLHDDPLQNLLSALQDLNDIADSGDPALRRSVELVELTIKQLREMVLDLHPVTLTYGGLANTVNALADRAAARGGFDCRVHVDSAASDVADDLVIAVVRELLTNAVKHAQASRVDVEIKRWPGGPLKLTVSDDGVGIANVHLIDVLREGHIGLASSAARIGALDGSFEIESEPPRGTTVRCVIPASDPEA
jgi:PAS domain S-box-containing protein